MKDYFHDICNCTECHYYDTEKPHCCGLPWQIRKAVHYCHCVNPNLWHFYIDK